MIKTIKIEKEELYDLYITQNLSGNEIAKSFGCSHNTIINKLRKHGIEIKSNSHCHTTVHITKEELIELYTNQKLSSNDIARTYQCNSETILNKLKKFNIPVRDRVSAIRVAKSKTFIDKDILHKLYNSQKRSIKQISEITGHSKSAVFNSLKEHKVERRSPNKAIKYEPNKEELVELYINQKLTIRQISDLLICSDASVHRRLIKYRIEMRKPASELKGEENPMWKGGISIGQYCNKFTLECKESNRDKFNRKCFLCGKNESENSFLNGKERKLSVHHVDYDKNQGCNSFDWKLVPLCHSCHVKTNYDEEYFDSLFTTMLNIREITLKCGNSIHWRSIV